MPALKTPTPAPQESEPASARARPRQAGEGDLGAPNPELQGHFDRIAEFAAEAPEPRVQQYSPPVRLAVFVALAALPWVAIWFAAKAILKLF